MRKNQTKKQLVTCLLIVLLTISTFSVLFKVPNVLQKVQAAPIGSFYPFSGASNPISGNPTDQHGFDVVHTTNIVQCNTIINGATWAYLAYDSNYEGSLINVYYSNSITGPWTSYSGNPILSGDGEFRTPSVVLVGKTFYMFLNNLNNADVELWTSTNGITFRESGTVLATAYDPSTNPFVWLNPNNNLWYLFWEQGYDYGGWWEIMARSSSTITGLSAASDTVVMHVGQPYNTAYPTIMYTNGEYWLLTEAETSSSSGLWRVNAWYSTNPTSGYSLSNNSPILTNDEACPQIFLTDNNTCYLFTNQDQTSNLWYQEIRTVYILSATVSVSPSSWTMDVGQSRTFTATPSGGTGTYTSYHWYVGGSAQSGQTASTFNYSPASAGSYSITATVTDSSGTTSPQSSAATVTVHSALVAPTASASKGTVDQTQISNLTSTTVSTGTSPYTYQWLQKAPGAGSYSPISGATLSNYSFATTSSTTVGTWSFELQVTDNASTRVAVTSAAVSVTVDASPTVSIAPVGPVTLDIGQVQVFTATTSGGSGSLSYQWYYTNGTSIAGAATSNLTFKANSTGTYNIYLNVTDNLGFKTKSNNATINIYSQPSVIINPNSVNMGVGSSNQFISSSVGGLVPYSYQWYLNNTAVQGATAADWTFTPTSVGAYNIYLNMTDNNNATVKSNTATATAYDPVVKSFDFGTATSPVQPGYTQVTESTLYSASLGYGWNSITGLDSRDRGAPNNATRDFVFSPTPHTFNVDLANGNYQITVIIGDQNYMHDQIYVYAQNVLEVNNLTVAAGSFQQTTFTTTITNGQLNLTIQDSGGLDPNFVINALTITVPIIVSYPTQVSFDFGTPSSPVQSGYAQVTESTLYSANLGYGWNSTTGLGSRDRGAPDNLTRDFVFSPTPHTFLVDLANGTYIVTVTIGDQSYGHDNINIYAQNTLQINNLNIPAGTFQQLAFTTTITNGQLNLTILDNGGADPNWVINALTIIPSSPPPTSGSFDFGTATSPVQPGYTKVTESTLYSANLGYGWNSTAGLDSRDRGSPDDLRRDFVFSSTDHTFNVDLANGNYQITVIIGDQNYMHDQIYVYAQGILEINNQTVTAGTFQQTTFTTTITNGQLNLRIRDGGGTDTNWIINALTITPS